VAEKRTESLFIRLTPSERRMIDEAIQAKYGVRQGEVRGLINRFARTAVLAYAKLVLDKKGRPGAGRT